MAAWRSFLRAHDRIVSELDSRLRRDHQITVAEYDVLVQLGLSPKRTMRMGDLAEATLFSPSGLTRLCQRLEELGYLERSRCPDDARGMEATLTTAGRRKLAAAGRSHLADVAELFAAPLSAGEIRALGSGLDRLAAGSG
jgi:DNA-binding MarR family transcriptional regulator